MTVRPFVAVIDDDTSVRKALGRLLRIAQMEAETFSSAETFLVAVLLREPDCLVLDVRMPGIGGPELQDRLHSSGRHIPIVFITAQDGDVKQSRGSGRRTAEILRKPFGDQSLVDAIMRAINNGGS